MRFTIEVTPDHLRRGRPRAPHQCPVALALREPERVKDAWVGTLASIVKLRGEPERRLVHDTALQRWITLFDGRRESGPVSVTVDTEAGTMTRVPEDATAP